MNTTKTESLFKFYKNPIKNNRSEYIYDGNKLITIRGFDKNDSLVSTIKFEYKTDTMTNWIERKAFENNTLNSIKTREIVYK